MSYGDSRSHEEFDGIDITQIESPDIDVDETQCIQDIQYIIQPTRLSILTQILATEHASLSPRELAFRNSDVTESTIRDHLYSMTTRNPQITQKLSPDVDHVPEGIPRTYYTVSIYGIELLKRAGVEDEIAKVYGMYQDKERSDEITNIEGYDNRPLPDWL